MHAIAAPDSPKNNQLGDCGRFTGFKSALAAVVAQVSVPAPLFTGGFAPELSTTLPVEPNEQLGGSERFDGDGAETVSVTVPEKPPEPVTVTEPVPCWPGAPIDIAPLFEALRLKVAPLVTVTARPAEVEVL